MHTSPFEAVVWDECRSTVEKSQLRSKLQNGQLAGRPTGSNPFHPLRDPLAAILPLFPRRLQLPIPLGLNLLLMPGEHVLWRDVADGAVRQP
jgi:hypothetical protein